jgi:general transcription factor 3C polypeptide 3 (transcription factor C subunit 4)
MNSSSDEDVQEHSLQPSRITGEIEQMLGEANRHFIFQEFDEAIEVLQEIIIKSPGIPDPYHVLALIHEEKREKEKSVGFLLLAAQMTQNDSSLWARVGHLYKELDQCKDAIYCFSRALLNQRSPDFELMKEK